MIDNDQSTIIEAPEVYKSIPTHFPSKNQRIQVFLGAAPSSDWTYLCRNVCKLYDSRRGDIVCRTVPGNLGT